jgi:hypothetical protein
VLRLIAGSLYANAVVTPGMSGTEPELSGLSLFAVGFICELFGECGTYVMAYDP